MPSLDLSQHKTLLTGGAGFLGSHVAEHLVDHGLRVGEIPPIGSGTTKFLRDHDVLVPRSRDYDLTRQQDLNFLFDFYAPTVVIHLAAVCGGIGLNRQKPGELFYKNLMMGVQLMDTARRKGVKKFVSVGTVCAYPKYTPAPFREDDLWAGYPEETNAPYGLAKKMLLVQGNAYRQQYNFNSIYLLPVNLYGPRDNFDPQSSHVIPALIRRFQEAKEEDLPEVTVWGTGAATREFLYVDDAATAIVLATQHHDSPDPVNLGSGQEITIRDLVTLIAELVGYHGRISWDHTKPDGQPRRLLDTSRAKQFGFTASTRLRDGLQRTISWYLSHR